MTANTGGLLTMQSANSASNTQGQSLTSVTTSAGVQNSQWTDTLAGGSLSSTSGTVFVGTSTVQPPTYTAPVGDMLTLMKTADGEFVLQGSGDTLKLLMDYFMQSPEMWLRLAAMNAEEKANAGST